MHHGIDSTFHMQVITYVILDKLESFMCHQRGNILWTASTEVIQAYGKDCLGQSTRRDWRHVGFRFDTDGEFQTSTEGFSGNQPHSEDNLRISSGAAGLFSPPFSSDPKRFPANKRMHWQRAWHGSGGNPARRAFPDAGSRSLGCLLRETASKPASPRNGSILGDFRG